MENKGQLKQARDWNKIVQDHSDTMFFVPEQFIKQTEEWQSKRLEFGKEANKLAQKENHLGLIFTQMIYAIRTHLAENGMPEIWTMDIGFNVEALKEGKFILNITKGERTV
jgi:hypothetical protein